MVRAVMCAVFVFLVEHAAAFEAGIAVRDVTPDPLLPVSGGVGPSHSVSESRGKLTVRALVLGDTDTTVAIVSADFLGFPAVLGDRVRARVPEIPAENILIGATHTHSAPDCYAFPNGKGGTDADLGYINSVCDSMAAVIRAAFEDRRPAVIRTASGVARGQIAYNYYAEKLYDPRCHVLQVVDAMTGQPFATLVNYAIHPEVLGPGSGVLSPDLVGPLYDRIENRGGGTGIFMNSAQGGMVTADNRTPDGGEIQTWSECVRIGSLLADEALRIVKSAPDQREPALDCFSATVRFPVESAELRAVMAASPLGLGSDGDGKDGNDGQSVSTRLNLLNVGDAQMLTIPGEALPNIGYFLKRNMRARHPFLLGLTNDAFGYILTRVDWNSFERYDYVSRVCLGEMTGEILIDASLKLIEVSPPAGR